MFGLEEPESLNEFFGYELHLWLLERPVLVDEVKEVPVLIEGHGDEVDGGGFLVGLVAGGVVEALMDGDDVFPLYSLDDLNLILVEPIVFGGGVVELQCVFVVVLGGEVDAE